jgi:predicted metalloendopeptidase
LGNCGGRTGSISGHEITNGCDDQGRKFDGKGNLGDWWTAQDAQAYEERGKCTGQIVNHQSSMLFLLGVLCG